MKRLAYYIGISSLFFAIVILEIIYLDFIPLTILIYIGSLVLYDIIRLSTSGKRALYNAFLNYDLYKLKQIQNDYHEPKLLTQTDDYHLYLMIDMIMGDFSQISTRYNEFLYFNDLEQYYTSYLFEYSYILQNDIEAFMNLHHKFKEIKNKVLEDRVITKEPGLIFIDRQTYRIELQVLDMVYSLYKDTISADYLQEYQFTNPVYNFVKEFALFHYYINTEQKQKARSYWEDSDYIYDLIKEEDLV